MNAAAARSALLGVARLLTPPIVPALLRRVGGRAAPLHEWEYLGSMWPTATSHRGWNVASVVDAQAARVPELRDRLTRADRAVSDDLATHNTMMSFAYALGRSAVNSSKVSVLDWGGGLGQYALLAHALYPTVDLDYNCRDLPLMAERGPAVAPGVTFHANDTTAFARPYDLVIASSSLQYVEAWRGQAAALAGVTARFLLVTRQPIAMTTPSFTIVQRPSRHGYDTEYAGWVLNRSELVSTVEEAGLRLRREFMIGEGAVVNGAPEPVRYRGFLFERVPS